MMNAGIILLVLALLDGCIEGAWTNSRQKRSLPDLPHGVLWTGRVFACAVISLFAYRSHQSAWVLLLFWIGAMALWAMMHRMGYNLQRSKWHPWWWMGSPDDIGDGSLYDDAMHLTAIALLGTNAGARPFVIAVLFEIAVAALCAIGIHLIN